MSLQKQADQVLKALQLPKAQFTGSYALDLMVWKDIDMQMVDADPKALVDAFLALPNLKKVHLMNCFGDYKPHWPRGVNVTARVDYPDFGGIWNLDMWIISQEQINENQALMAKLKERLTAPLKKLILDMKYELMGQGERVPPRCSHNLYQAVLMHGLREKKEIFRFLEEAGVLKVP